MRRLLFLLMLSAGCGMLGVAAPTESVSAMVSGESQFSVAAVDVAPVGWRRTRRGWERAENWPITAPNAQATTLNGLIKRQQSAELAWAAGPGLSAAMQFIRRVDPVTIVCVQVTLLALYTALVFNHESKAGSKPCPNRSKSMSIPSAD
jgi:hypothetical protein